MKYILTLATALLMAFSAFAQPQQPPQGQGRPDGMPPMFGQFEQKDPAQLAQDETDRLNQLVGLTEKQYKKIYKFNKRQYNQLQTKMENTMPQGFPGGPGGPGMGGSRPDGMGPGGPGGMGPGGFGGGRPDGMGPGGPRGPRGGQRPDMGQGRPGMGGEMQELMEEMKEKKEKKYRKILTPEQYMKWESFEAERDFRRMRERPE